MSFSRVVQGNGTDLTTRAANGPYRRVATRQPAAVLNAAESARLSGITAKNTLTPHDASLVEQAFRAKLKARGETGTVAAAADSNDEEPDSDPKVDATLAQDAIARSSSGNGQAQKGSGPLNGVSTGPLDVESTNGRNIVSSVHRGATGTRHTFGSWHRKCLICGRQPCDPHHLRSAQPQALGRKVSDEFSVPLCRTHHREAHRSLDESNWWSRFGLDPFRVASALWAQTRPLPWDVQTDVQQTEPRPPLALAPTLPTPAGK